MNSYEHADDKPAAPLPLQEQLAFYFSDANLRKDRFLHRELETAADGYVPIDMFMRFNKVKALTTDLAEVVTALRGLGQLEVSADGSRVRRRSPFDAAKDVDACTIYVEGLKHDTTLEKVRDKFARFGPVVYVSLPRFASGKRGAKGFAFVEFETAAAAAAAIASYRPADAAGVTPLPALAHVAVSALTAWGPPELPAVTAAAGQRRPGRQLAVLTKAEWAALKTQYKQLQRNAAVAAAQQKAQDAAAAAVTAAAAHTAFERGVLVQVGALPAGATKATLREQLQLAGPVEFVDLDAGVVRMRAPADARAALEHPALTALSLSVLAGPAEDTYFGKVAAVREARAARKNPLEGTASARRQELKLQKQQQQQQQQAPQPPKAQPQMPPAPAPAAAAKPKKEKMAKRQHQRFDDDDNDTNNDTNNDNNNDNNNEDRGSGSCALAAPAAEEDAKAAHKRKKRAASPVAAAAAPTPERKRHKQAEK